MIEFQGLSESSVQPAVKFFANKYATSAGCWKIFRKTACGVNLRRREEHGNTFATDNRLVRAAFHIGHRGMRKKLYRGKYRKKGIGYLLCVYHHKTQHFPHRKDSHIHKKACTDYDTGSVGIVIYTFILLLFYRNIYCHRETGRNQMFLQQMFHRERLSIYI